MVPRVGQRIGPYEILGRLGSGGMGLVFSAWDARLQRDVAIKLLREEYATPGMRSRFLQEARAASRLNHANICTIFDIGEREGDPYLVMELLKGETIRARVTRGPMPVEDVLRVATEIADALIVAHERGIIHRDIKPANIILVEKTGGGFQTKVLDFGLAKMDLGDVLETTRFDLTSMGTTVGTVAYMSPEQARGEALDSRSDLFSLGVVLYEMATGELPFQGATSALVFVQLLSERPEPIRNVNQEVPKDFERVIMTLLAKKRSDRYQTAGDLVDALHKIVLKRGGAGKSIWGARPSRFLSRRESEAPSKPTVSEKKQTSDSSKPKDAISPERTRPSEGEVVRASSSSDSFLRPVKRIATGEVPSALSRPAAESEGYKSSPPRASGINRIVVPVAPQTAVATSGSSSNAIPAQEMKASEAVNASEAARLAASKAAQKVPAKRFERTADFDHAEEEAETDQETGDYARSSWKKRWIMLAAVLALAAGGSLAWYQATHPAAPIADVPTSLLLISLENQTGDSTISGLLNAGMMFDLQQSPHLSLRSQEDLVAAMKSIGFTGNAAEPSMDDARRIAMAAGASNMAFGDIHTDGSSYQVSMRVYDVAKGTRLIDATETAFSREQIADAIDRLASEVRSGLGETGDSIGKTSLPLNREATSNLDALQAFETGVTLTSSGQEMDALFAFEHSVAMEPRFTQGYLVLADLYRKQHAEVASAKAATKAQDNAASGGARTQTLAQASYAMNALGDYDQAIAGLQRFRTSNPADLAARVQLAVSERQTGKFAESLAMAQSVLKAAPFNAEARVEAELDLIGLERVDAAAQLEQQAQKAGQGDAGIGSLLSLLGADVEPAAEAQEALRIKVYEASVLDAKGEFGHGLSAWRDVVSSSRATPELASSASYALASAALDRAMATDCVTALSLVREGTLLPAGPDAQYASGMASALCTDLDGARKSLSDLTSGSAQAFAGKNIYIPTLTAAIQWKAGDATGALATLQGADAYDLLSMSAYLRGIIHLSSNQPAGALSDFQAVLLHRGSMSLVNPEMYAVAQLQTARAYWAMSDKANSSASYKRFLNLWTTADTTNPLLLEAQLRTR